MLLVFRRSGFGGRLCSRLAARLGCGLGFRLGLGGGFSRGFGCPATTFGLGGLFFLLGYFGVLFLVVLILLVVLVVDELEGVFKEAVDVAGAPALAALVPIVNPLGNAPIFLAMSADLPAAGRRRLATIAARNALLLLVSALLIGSYVLRFFGISLPVVRVAGGMVLMASGWRLLHAGDPEPGHQPGVVEAWEREADRRGFYPLAFPLTIGPGSISVAITLGAGVRVRDVTDMTAILGGVVGAVLVSAGVYLSYRFASRLLGALGGTGTVVFLRLSAFILLCIGVKILCDGLVERFVA